MDVKVEIGLAYCSSSSRSWFFYFVLYFPGNLFDYSQFCRMVRFKHPPCLRGFPKLY